MEESCGWSEGVLKVEKGIFLPVEHREFLEVEEGWSLVCCSNWITSAQCVNHVAWSNGASEQCSRWTVTSKERSACLEEAQPGRGKEEERFDWGTRPKWEMGKQKLKEETTKRIFL